VIHRRAVTLLKEPLAPTTTRATAEAFRTGTDITGTGTSGVPVC
jgi:hypothetical protein